MTIDALVPLAHGFEEIEAVTIIDTLRRADLQVWTVGIGETQVEGAHGISVVADGRLEDMDPASCRAIVLPGGQPGTKNLQASSLLKRMLLEFHQQKKWLAAICAAPSVLAQSGILANVKACCYPGVEKSFPGVNFVLDPVVVSGHIITSRGVGTALDFSLALVRQLKDAATADELRSKMLVRLPKD